MKCIDHYLLKKKKKKSFVILVALLFNFITGCRNRVQFLLLHVCAKEQKKVVPPNEQKPTTNQGPHIRKWILGLNCRILFNVA